MAASFVLLLVRAVGWMSGCKGEVYWWLQGGVYVSWVYCDVWLSDGAVASVVVVVFACGMMMLGANW